MSIPSNISSELLGLQTQLAAASPLNSASFAVVKALQLNAANLVGDIDTALVASSLLDTWLPPPDPISIVAGFWTVVTAATDQDTLSLMRGIVGRSSANLDQLV